MISRGVATADGTRLEVQCAEDKLWMTIRRVDGCQDPGFARFDGREIGVIEIGMFLPNWATLSWTQIKDSDLSHGQWSAHDCDYRINIYGDPGSSLWHGQVMALYCRFMGESD
ncbi:MAG: hypothetical protein Q7K57_01445 [Burkholderiaceae bacterium]|nr:hypothetical protein [Burkholderiaceae bacterium]